VVQVLRLHGRRRLLLLAMRRVLVVVVGVGHGEQLGPCGGVRRRGEFIGVSSGKRRWAWMPRFWRCRVVGGSRGWGVWLGASLFVMSRMERAKVERREAQTRSWQTRQTKTGPRPHARLSPT
jgi:hypothetical protein